MLNPLKQIVYSKFSGTSVLSWRNLLFFLGFAVFFYAGAVVLHVLTLPDLGIRSTLSREMKTSPPRIMTDHDGELKVASVTLEKPRFVKRVGDQPIQNWFALLDAPTRIRNGLNVETAPVWAREHEGQTWIEVILEDGKGGEQVIFVPLAAIPWRDIVPSFLWFLLKLGLFIVGGLVLWKKPFDPAATQFFLLCVVTFGAYIGGYHWTHLVTSPWLLLVFLGCSLMLPPVSLHFYHVFPRQKHWLLAHPRLTLAVIYGPAAGFLGLLAWMYVSSYRMALAGFDPGETWRAAIANTIYGYFGLGAMLYLGSVFCLIHSFRSAINKEERNQVKIILIGASLALIPIGYSLYLAVGEGDAFSAGAATWPMFFASTFITIAYAISITRYRLMELDKILSSSAGYFFTSFLAAALYYFLVFVGTLIFNQYIAGPSLTEALAVSTTALILMLGLDLARARIKKALDRRYSRDKGQLDRTMHQLGQEIEKLVDAPSLAAKMLSTTADVLNIHHGAIYLLQPGEPQVYRLAGTTGQSPPLEELSPYFPLVEAVRSGKVVLSRSRLGSVVTASQKQLQFLRGEIAQPLIYENRLLAILILGPKDPPYRTEDLDLLTALAQVTALAIASAEGHRIIDQLNQELQTKVQKISEQQRRILSLQSQLHRQSAPTAVPEDAEIPPELTPAPPLGGIVGKSPIVQGLLDLVRKVAGTDAVVLLRGESGTGKELLAQALVESSPRAGKPFIKVHCAALSASLLESELFGHVKGAFTGAHKDKVGRFELASGGTLFLDEIGDINLEVQTKLLRVLQERTIERVGSGDPIAVDVRIITATNQNLENLIQVGRFREDLFYRLNVFPIYAPALRQRPGDIPDLVRHFIKQSAQACKKDVADIDDQALELLVRYAWPGNIRQLQNVIERAVVIADGNIITTHEIPEEMFSSEARAMPRLHSEGFAPTKSTRPLSARRQERLRREREELMQALSQAGGNRAEAARVLGIARSTLVSRLKKLGLD